MADENISRIKLASKFRGCMIGGLVGDCLGRPYEFQSCVPERNIAKNLNILMKEVSSQRLPHTDDSSMTISLASSLVENGEVNAKDMAKRFVDEFYNDGINRSYGFHVRSVFKALRKNNYSDVYSPAKLQFNGKGSYGNGAAMRISPVVLFGYSEGEEYIINTCKECSYITHTHRNGYNGAILQCLAVNAVLGLDSSQTFDPVKFIDSLKAKMRDIEGETSTKKPFCQRLDDIKHIYVKNQEDISAQRIAVLLGNDEIAIDSVPTAIYAFLRGMKPLKEYETSNPFLRTMCFAISIGGDTDTIASMAGSIAGAYYGAEIIPEVLQKKCEAIDKITHLSFQLFKASQLPDTQGSRVAKDDRSAPNQPTNLDSQGPRVAKDDRSDPNQPTNLDTQNPEYLEARYHQPEITAAKDFSSTKLDSKFRGCMIGGLMGDCLGHSFEGHPCVPEREIAKYLNRLMNNESVQILPYAAESSMTISLASSLAENGKVNAQDMAKRFVEEFFNERRKRNYGLHIQTVFKAIRENNYTDVFTPAKVRFNCSGSYSNGAATRTSPVALFGYREGEKFIIKTTKECSSITHTHRDGYNGAILQCLAVNEVLRLDSSQTFDPVEFIDSLRAKMKDIEGTIPFRKPFCQSLKKIKQVYVENQEDISSIEIAELLGNDITAVGSVPTAIYAFLRGMKPLKEYKSTNPFLRTLCFAISIGGDADTIASMAGSIAGAYYGADIIPDVLQKKCEAIDTVITLSDKLFEATQK